MALNGLESGLNNGRLNGRLTGSARAKSLSGMLNGRSNGIANKKKLQDPVLISSARNDTPFIYFNADNVVTSGTTVTSITNLLGTYNPLTQSALTSFAVSGTLTQVQDAVFNHRSAFSYSTSTTVFGVLGAAVPNMTNTSEMTVMFVAKLVSTSRGVLFWKKSSSSDPVISDTTGDMSIEFDGTNLNVFFIGSPTTETAQWRAVDATLKNNWVLITVKARLFSPTGPGSYIDIFINGKRCKTAITDTITSFGRTPATTWSNQYIQFGNSSVFNAGNLIAGGMITEQWINEEEQIKLENYFRWYYGYNF